MSAPNIVNVATVTGSTAVQAVSTAATAIVSNSSGSNTVIKINSLSIANVNGTAAATITASLYRSSVDYRLAYLISVPAGSSLIVLDRAMQVYLQEGDSLRLTASANSYLEAVCSYETIS
jgi:stress response protein SCP2